MQFLNGLELKYIYHEDEAHLGKKIANLVKLYHAKLPVPDGIIVLPPIVEIKAILKDLRIHTPNEFEERENQLRDKILDINLPAELKGKYKKYQFEKGWKKLLLQWLLTLKSQIYLKENINLEPKIIFFVHKPTHFGQAFIDPYTQKVQIQLDGGKLDEDFHLLIESLVKKCDKHLVIPHRYEWIFDNGFKIIGVKSINHQEPKAEKFSQPEILHLQPKNTTKKGSTKVFFDATDEQTLSSGDKLSPDKDIDGMIIDSSLLDSESSFTKRLEYKIWKLTEGCLSNYSMPVLYKLNKEKIKEDAEVVSFIRHKKQLLNLQIGIPVCKSSSEFSEIKRELASLNLSRKGSLKIWLEIGNGENFINCEEYFEVGLDGVIINVDQLIASFYGQEGEIDPQKAAGDIKKYLSDYLPKFKKSNVPVLVFGSLLTADDLIRFLVEKKIWGVVINTSSQYGLRDYVYEIEKFFFPKYLES